MRATPTLHEIDFGESIAWVPPDGAARFHVWTKTDAYSWFDDKDPSDMTYGGTAPRWTQVAGFDVENGAALDIDVNVSVKPGPTFDVGAAGVVVDWQSALVLFGGYDPDVLMVTAMTADAKVMSIDRYRLPSPNSTDAATIAAQERRLLQTLLNSREKVAASGGKAKVTASESDGYELMELAALDRRVAEVRARIRWFELAAAGNAMPRAEHW